MPQAARAKDRIGLNPLDHAAGMPGWLESLETPAPARAPVAPASPVIDAAPSNGAGQGAPVGGQERPGSNGSAAARKASDRIAKRRHAYHVEVDLVKAVRSFAYWEERTSSDVVNTALREYLTRHMKKQRNLLWRTAASEGEAATEPAANAS